jgi:hypothetical protein
MNNCQFIISFALDPPDNMDEFGDKVGQKVTDIVFCDRPASIKHDGLWYCAPHYDELCWAANGIVISGLWHYFSVPQHAFEDRP